MADNKKDKRYLAYLRRKLKLQLQVFKSTVVDLRPIWKVCEEFKVTEKQIRLWTSEISSILEEEFHDCVTFSGRYASRPKHFLKHRVDVHQGIASKDVLGTGNERTYIPNEDTWYGETWPYYLEDMREDSGVFAHLLYLFRLAERKENESN